MRILSGFCAGLTFHPPHVLPLCYSCRPRTPARFIVDSCRRGSSRAESLTHFHYHGAKAAEGYTLLTVNVDAATEGCMLNTALLDKPLKVQNTTDHIVHFWKMCIPWLHLSLHTFPSESSYNAILSWGVAESPELQFYIENGERIKDKWSGEHLWSWGYWQAKWSACTEQSGPMQWEFSVPIIFQHSSSM